MTSDATTAQDRRDAFYWYRRGMLQVLTIPALILFTAFIGFAGFARESGISGWMAAFMTGAIWALPAKMVLVACISGGLPLLTTFLAVTLSSARFLPMVAALVTDLRTKNTRTAVLLFLSHFVAVTSYVIFHSTYRNVPEERRTVFFAGFSVTLAVLNMILVALVYNLAPHIPAFALAAMFFVTPMYFLCSMWATARDRTSLIALVLGLALGPPVHEIAPQFSLVIVGVVGGFAAYAIGRMLRAREAKS